MMEENKPGDIVSAAKKHLEQSQEAHSHNRTAWLEDLRFGRLGQQWPEQVKAQRERDQRPCLTINKLPAFVRQVVNDSRQNRPAITTHPVDSGADVATSEVINGLIRNIEQASDADVAYDTAVDHAASCGFGYIRVDLDYAYDDTFDLDVKIERVINPLMVHPDHTSTAADSSDWNYCLVETWLPKDEFQRKYPDAKGADFAGMDGNWYNDDDGVMVAEYWVRSPVSRTIALLSDGQVVELEQYEDNADTFAALGLSIQDRRDVMSHKVHQYIIGGDEVLEDNDWPGRFIPVVPVYGEEVVEEGKIHYRSLVRDAVDSQRMYNYWRTAMTETVALAPRAPFVGPKGAFNSSPGKWATANSASHAYLEYEGQVPPQRQPPPMPDTAAMQLALSSSDDMKAVMGIYDASLGSRSNETSGRAIMARQREGDTSTFHIIDNLSRAIRHVGRIVLDLIPHVYSKPRVLRVIGKDMQPMTVQVNQPHAGPDGTERLFDLTKGRYDLTVNAGPSFTSKREEAASQMIEFVRAFPQAAPVLGDLLAKNLDWPEAQEIAKRLQALLPPPAQGQNPQLTQMQQAIQVLQNKLQQVEQDKSLEVRKLDIDAYNAETNRLKAMGGAMTPELVQQLVMQTMQQLMASPDVLPPAPPAPLMPPQAPPSDGMPPNQPPQGGFFMPEGSPSM